MLRSGDLCFPVLAHACRVCFTNIQFQLIRTPQLNRRIVMLSELISLNDAAFFDLPWQTSRASILVLTPVDWNQSL